MKLSIIIVNFNSGELLKNCLSSVNSSTFPSKDYELILVDNCSQDSSINKALPINIPNLTLIKNNQNSGFAKANNQGINISTGEYILLLNPDTILGKSTLQVMVNYMDKNRDVAVATCRVELPNGEIDDACHRGFPTPLNALFHFSGVGRLFRYNRLLNGYHLGYSNLNKIHEIDSCVGAFMLIRRSVGEELSWLDENYFWYGEDIDFCFRVKEKGYKVMYLPTTKITHFKGISSGIKNHSKQLSTASLETKKLATKARFDVMRIFYKKHYMDKYPKVLTELVFLGINLKERLTAL